MKIAIITLMICLFFVFTSPTLALNKCVGTDGKITYSDRACSTVVPEIMVIEEFTPKLDDAPPPSYEMQLYCTKLYEFALDIAYEMQRGRDSGEALTRVGKAVRNNPHREKIVNYVYGYKHTKFSRDHIANNIRTRCLAGMLGP